MTPLLGSGDFVIASRFYFTIRVNDVLVVNHPQYQRIIKRVARICPERGIWLSGDHHESVSSMQMNWVARSYIQGKVIFSIKRKKIVIL